MKTIIEAPDISNFPRRGKNSQDSGLQYHDCGKKSMKNEKQIPCEIFTRVVGYYRPVKQFNKGKKEEFNERVYITDKKGKLNDEKKGC